MKVLVAVKRVVDAYVNIRIKPDQSGIETTNVKMSINPFCEIAIEEAVRLKEKGTVSEIIAVSVGPKETNETLRTALALGSDRAIQVITDIAVEPLAIAKILKAIVEKESPDMVILGKQAIDTDNSQTGQMLAALLDWPQGTFASEIEINNGEATVVREIDGGQETLSMKLPAVFTSDLRLNEPRFASLPNIIKAKRKPIESISAEELGIDITPRIEIIKIVSPPVRQSGIIVKSVAELVDKLKNEAKVIS